MQTDWPQVIDEASVWKPSIYADESHWIVHFTESQLAEIEQAARHVLSSGKNPTSFRKSDFTLPTVASLLDDLLHTLGEGRGFVFLRGLDVTRYDIDTLKTIYWGICSYIGEGISQNAQGEAMSAVTDYGDSFEGDDPYRHNIRAHRTTTAIHPHTDSCDYVALLCVRPAKSGGESAVVSSLAIYNELMATHPEYLEPLRRGFFLDLVGKGTSEKQLSFHRIPVFSYFNGKMSARFNLFPVLKSSRCGRRIAR